MGSFLNRAIDEFKRDIVGYIIATVIYVVICVAISFAVGAVTAIIQIAFYQIFQNMSPQIAKLLIYGIKLLTNLIVSALTIPLLLGYFFAIKERIRQGQMDYGNLFRCFSLNYLLPGYLAVIIINILIFLVMTLFMLPGVIMQTPPLLLLGLFPGLFVVILISVSVGFTNLFILDGETNGISAILKSKSMVMNNFLSYAYLFLLVGGLQIIGAVLCLVGLLATVPIGFIAIVLCFEEHKFTISSNQ